MTSLQSLAELKTSDQELFNDVTFSSIMPLLSDCATRNLDKDEVLIKMGDTKKSVYLILSGSFNVHLTRDNSDPVEVLRPGQSIGEMSIIDHQPSSAFVSAA